jgi:hypothetical protein
MLSKSLIHSTNDHHNWWRIVDRVHTPTAGNLLRESNAQLWRILYLLFFLDECKINKDPHAMPSSFPLLSRPCASTTASLFNSCSTILYNRGHFLSNCLVFFLRSSCHEKTIRFYRRWSSFNVSVTRPLTVRGHLQLSIAIYYLTELHEHRCIIIIISLVPPEMVSQFQLLVITTTVPQRRRGCYVIWDNIQKKALIEFCSWHLFYLFLAEGFGAQLKFVSFIRRFFI